MGRRALSRAAPAAGDGDLAELAKGGRTNFFGFLLRLAARIPFLVVAGRIYGAENLGRFAFAVLIVEFAAQIATLGLKRGLAQQLSGTERPHVDVVWDGLLVAAVAAALAVGFLIAVPQVMFPNSAINGFDRFFPLAIFALAWSDVALAALAYRHDVAATVRARAVVEPWTISIAAFAFSFYSVRDGLILAYAVSMVAAFVASIVPLLRSYGRPRAWRPEPRVLAATARRNVPLAGADAIEWATRNVDRAILGLFFPPAVVGIYWVAQQIATLPQKLKTSFDPILGPVITQNLEAGDRRAVAAHVRQVGFWIIAAQAGIGLSLGITGEAVMGLFGPAGAFVGGTGALAFLLAAEVVAATAVVSEAALVYVARHRNLMISLATLALQIALSFALILIMRDARLPAAFQAAGPAVALAVALAFASVMKSRLLAQLLGAPVSGWRWALVWATGAAAVVGAGVVLLPEWAELALGVPAILAAYGLVIWYRGFTEADRTLFRMKGPPERADPLVQPLAEPVPVRVRPK